MYLALARKYRPQSFADLVGQDPVVRTLTQAILLNRIHHAYLFCGARGVGKTSMARILAKSINCEKGPTATPCQVCKPCQEITRGNAMDVIEIDAASHTGVDNIRELREQVKYLPTQGKYKIYIIDEVHMLSASAFNALLKTLEEPPGHVLFILATTEPHDLPITILSRCQRFDFRKLNTAFLAAHLRKVLAGEGIAADEAATLLLAEGAQGSVRDALSLLDQVIGYAQGKITETDARAVLGMGDRKLLQEAFRAVVSEDLVNALAALTQADEQGLDLKIFAEDLLMQFRHLILTLSTQKTPDGLSAAEADFLQELATKVELSLALAQYQILFQGAFELGRTEFQKMSLEVTFVKMNHVRDLISLADLVTELKERAEKRSGPITSVPRTAPMAPTEPQKNMTIVSEVVADSAKKTAADWYELVKWIRSVKAPLGGLLSEAIPLSYTDQKIEIGFAPTSPTRQLVIERKSAVEEILFTHFGRKVDFVVSHLESEKKKP